MYLFMETVVPGFAPGRDHDELKAKTVISVTVISVTKKCDGYDYSTQKTYGEPDFLLFWVSS